MTPGNDQIQINPRDSTVNSGVDNIPSSMLEGVKSVSVSLNKHSSHIYVYFPVKTDSGEGDHPSLR